jgi:galactokinase
MPGVHMVGASALRDFEEYFGRTPTHIVRAPGRVNLIGEHIDYHRLPVMPFALDRAVYVVFATADGSGSDRPPGRVRIATGAGKIAEGAFEPDEFMLDGTSDGTPAGTLDGALAKLPAGDWRNYVRAAAQSLMAENGATTGMDAWVASDLPVASGLSSSSALVVAVGLALARANQIVVGRRAFAEKMASAERFTGTQGGGMDQAASLLSQEGCLSLIDFGPLRVEHVPFPDELRVLLASSGEVAEKSGTVQAEYNERRETGARALDRVSRDLGYGGATFRGLLTGVPAAKILSTAAELLDPQELSRFNHVVTEWYRVRLARKALESRDHAGLGRLLTASHASLRDDYGVSTPALDALVAAAQNAGALGARLTGAGFGGSAVALTTRDTEKAVRDALVEVAGSSEAVISVRPAAGAGVVEI